MKKEERLESTIRDNLRMQIEESADMPTVEDYIMQKKVSCKS